MRKPPRRNSRRAAAASVTGSLISVSRWPDAKDYLKTLQDASETGLLDLSLLQTDKYEEVMRQSISKLWAGEDPKAILDKAAADWDAITQEIGVDKQKAVYADWASKSGAYPK